VVDFARAPRLHAAASSAECLALPCATHQQNRFV